MTKFNQSLANRIIRLRKKGLSQRAIAKKIGISHVTIQKWLKKGENNPDSKYYNLYVRWNNDNFLSNEQLEDINDLFSKTINKEYKNQHEKIFIIDYMNQSEYDINEVVRMLTYVKYRDLEISLFYKFVLEMSEDIKPTFTYMELDNLMKQYLCCTDDVIIYI